MMSKFIPRFPPQDLVEMDGDELDRFEQILESNIHEISRKFLEASSYLWYDCDVIWQQYLLRMFISTSLISDNKNSILGMQIIYDLSNAFDGDNFKADFKRRWKIIDKSHLAMLRVYLKIMEVEDSTSGISVAINTLDAIDRHGFSYSLNSRR